jgi:DNA-binding response OmpR family regulator
VTVARIIAIEDSPALQRLLAITMRDTGIEIEAFLLGAPGLEAAIEDPPDLVVLDLGLPDMPGWEILERLRSEPSTVNVPVVVATGESRSVVINRLSELNAVMLEKPYTGAVIRATLRVLVEADAEVGSPT